MINCIIVGLITFIFGCIAGSFVTLLGVSAGSSVTRKAVEMNTVTLSSDVKQTQEDKNPNDNIMLY